MYNIGSNLPRILFSMVVINWVICEKCDDERGAMTTLNAVIATLISIFLQRSFFRSWANCGPDYLIKVLIGSWRYQMLILLQSCWNKVEVKSSDVDGKGVVFGGEFGRT